MFNNKSIFITGATGSLGSYIVKHICENYLPKKIVLISRNEYCQYKLTCKYSKYPFVNIHIVDIRDIERLNTLMCTIDYVIHTAALKHVELCENNPFEAVQTNILGSQNIVNACLKNNVEKCIFISTDKANLPSSLYGSTKFIADKLCLSANYNNKTKFSVARFGNFFGSRGSVVEKFVDMRNKGILNYQICEKEVTRAFITRPEIVGYLIKYLTIMIGGEIFIPNMKSILINDLPKAMNDNCTIEYTGMKNGERIHEIIIPKDEVNNTYENENYYVIIPTYTWLSDNRIEQFRKTYTKKIKYTQEIDSSHFEFYSVKDIKDMVEKYVKGEI